MPNFTSILQGHYNTSQDRIVLQLLHGGQPDRAVSYGDLVEGAAGYAQTFRESGIQPGGRWCC